jgi:hypothetical protein
MLRYDFLLDVNECSTAPEKCDRNANCSNTVGSFTCACLPGYSGDGIVNCRGKYSRILYSTIREVCHFNIYHNNNATSHNYPNIGISYFLLIVLKISLHTIRGNLSNQLDLFNSRAVLHVDGLAGA